MAKSDLKYSKLKLYPNIITNFFLHEIFLKKPKAFFKIKNNEFCENSKNQT